MKRLQLTPQIEQYLRRAVGADANLSELVVFEATALNTLPLRKQHPLFKGAIVEPTALFEMAQALRAESRPVHIQHDKEPLPIGRVFHGEVQNNGSETELRVLFWIEAGESEALRKVENGTVDQVSVSVLFKQALNSVSGFDYMGPEATFEHFLSGDDGEGNILGQNGVHAKLVGLDNFFEMSLVSQGGAQQARIHRRDQSHFGSSYEQLAASGLDPNVFVLAATFEEPKMDLSELVTKLTEREVEVARLTDAAAVSQTEIETLQARVTALEAELATANTNLEAAQAENVDDLKTNLASATAGLKSVAQVLQAAAGKTEDLPDAVADLNTLIEARKTDLAGMLVAGGSSKRADQNSISSPIAAPSVNPYRLSR